MARLSSAAVTPFLSALTVHSCCGTQCTHKCLYKLQAVLIIQGESVAHCDQCCGCGRLSYDEGADEESFEWVDFRELTDQEVRQHAAHIVVQSRPPTAPRPPPTPAAAPKSGATDPEQVSILPCCLLLTSNATEVSLCNLEAVHHSSTGIFPFRDKLTEGCLYLSTHSLLSCNISAGGLCGSLSRKPSCKSSMLV